MGQYHVLVNLDKQEVVSPHGLGLGLKQYEHTTAITTARSQMLCTS